MTPNQLRAARAALQLSVADLANLADVYKDTIGRFENERGGLQASTQAKLIEALTGLGITLLDDDGNGYGIRFKG
jgi:DNA-binding XRE family transcriptional regulator